MKECIYNTRTVCCNDVFCISVNICKVWWNLSYILSAYLSFLCLLSWSRVFQIIDGLLHWQCPDYIVVKHLVLNTWEHEGLSYLRYKTYHQYRSVVFPFQFWQTKYIKAFQKQHCWICSNQKQCHRHQQGRCWTHLHSRVPKVNFKDIHQHSTITQRADFCSGEDMLEFKLEKENSPESDPHDPFRMPIVSLSWWVFLFPYNHYGFLGLSPT